MTSKHTGDPAYEALDPAARLLVDYLEENYDDPATAARNLLAYIEKHRQPE